MIPLADLRPGLAATIHTPENERLHGETCVVRVVTHYGAVVDTTVGSGEFRALESELNPVALKPPRSPNVDRAVGYTGNQCSQCGSTKMVRSGTCETCIDCGNSNGGCS